MPTPAELTTWPFLSIVAWPEGWDRASVAQLLAGFGAMDVATLNQRLGQKPPMVLNHVDPSVAPAMVAALVDRGGDGFHFTLDDLTRLGPTMRIADLAVGEGTLDITLHDGSVIHLHKTSQNYDPYDKENALHHINQYKKQGKIATGLLYINQSTSDLHELLDTVDKPFNSLGKHDLCPGNEVLADINQTFR